MRIKQQKEMKFKGKRGRKFRRSNGHTASPKDFEASARALRAAEAIIIQGEALCGFRPCLGPGGLRTYLDKRI